MAAECTHGLIASASGTTTIGEALIGAVELPTRGQAWKLHNLNGQVCRAAATAAEFSGGYMGIDSVSGDISPDPAPSRYPLMGSGSFLGASDPVETIPIQKYELDLDAAGKANLNLVYNAGIALTAAPIVNIGVHFGPNIPQARPFKFSDRVRGTATVNTNTQIGTIQLSEKANKITGIIGFCKQDGVLVTAEELTGFFSLRSDDVDLAPSFWLFNEIFGAGLGTVIGGGRPTAPQVHVVDIPVPGGARIDCFVDTVTAVTNAADFEIFLMYE